jgi:hypothetical protein
MPWHIAKAGACPTSRPWAVIKDDDGDVEGCHATRTGARAQLAALYASEAAEAVQEATDPDAYAHELYTVLAQIGSLTGEAETAMVELLDDARREVQRQLADLPLDSPSRSLLERARAGIDQTTANLADDMGTTLADLQDQGHALGIDLALKPLGGRQGVEALAAGVTLDQLQIMQAFSARLIQDIPDQLRKRINGEIASVVIGAKSPHQAALAIGANLTDANHFSTIAHRARAIVVTEVGRAHALGTQNAQTALANSLANAGDTTQVKKRWLNAHLPGARATHIAAEGAYAPGSDPGPIPHDAFFQIAGHAAYYPRDPALPAGESVHCHCVAITVLDEGSTAAAGNPATTAPAKAAYTKAKAEKAAPAEAKTKKLNAQAATFLADPYTAAGLNPVKSLKTGGSGYGGQVMAKKLGYANAKDSGFVWDKTLGAWKHPAAAAGKQLPDFKDLKTNEQWAVMTSAKLDTATKKAIVKELDIKPAKPIPAPPTAPTMEPPPPPKPTPPPPPPTRQTVTRPARRQLGRVQAYGSEGSARKPAVSRGRFLDRIKQIDDRGYSPSPTNSRSAVKDSIMRRVGARMQPKLDAALDKATQTELLTEMADDLRRSAYGAQTDAEHITSQLIGTWAASSGDSHRWALALQKKAADMFDLPWPPVGYASQLAKADNYSKGRFGGHTLAENVDIINDRYGTVLEAFLEAMYEETQEELDRLFPGKDEINLVRGMRVAVGATDTIQHQEVMLNPMSSFAINTTISKRFGSTLLYGKVPKERIIGTATSGYGCLNEYEFVVLGAPDPETFSVIRG